MNDDKPRRSARAIRWQHLAGAQSVRNYYLELARDDRNERARSFRRAAASDLDWLINRELWRPVTEDQPAGDVIVNVFTPELGSITALRRGDEFVCACGCLRPILNVVAFQQRSAGPRSDDPTTEPNVTESGRRKPPPT
jgi:hypothetical protein